MSKVTKDDIGAIASRIDAQTAILIELLVELKVGHDKSNLSKKYQKKYDRMAAKLRAEIIS